MRLGRSPPSGYQFKPWDVNVKLHGLRVKKGGPTPDTHEATPTPSYSSKGYCNALKPPGNGGATPSLFDVFIVVRIIIVFSLFVYVRLFPFCFLHGRCVRFVKSLVAIVHATYTDKSQMRKRRKTDELTSYLHGWIDGAAKTMNTHMDC